MKKLVTGMLCCAIAFISCKKDKNNPTVPTLTTTTVSNLSYNTATSGGTITGNGGATITASGICWSMTNNMPTINDSLTHGTVSSGSFTAVMNNLTANSTYYVRAYATNSVGTGYGNVLTFSTTMDTTKITFTYNGQSVTYGVITSSVTGKKWMDRNLGASRAALYSSDSLAYGDLFNWGRLADGHQLRTSTTTTTLSSTDNPGNNQFIYNSSSATFYDWRNPQNANLWQGSTGVNNPCPSGWHVPTQTEWNNETGMTDSTSAFSRLKLVLAGYRSRLSGNVVNFGTSGQYAYWSSTTTGNNSYEWIGAAGTGGIGRAQGGSVRCVKD